MVEVSQDIFYQVKKQILDKLDLVLQKVNLEIINYIHPHQDQFSFIELSSFQTELENLFHYLDRLYASLNSSVSFSSIHSTVQTYQVENLKLHHEIEQLKSKIKEINHQKNIKTKDIMTGHGSEQKRMANYCQVLKNEIKILSSQMNMVSKDIKTLLKGYKFDTLQSRVQIMSRMRDFQQLTVYKSSKTEDERQCIHEQQQHSQNSQQILRTINQLLLIC